MNPAVADTCAALLEQLHTNHLLSFQQAQEAQHFLTENPGLTTQDLLGHLTSAEMLTHYQAQRILDGHMEDLHILVYVILDEVTHTSTGPVYKAMDRVTRKLVTMKLMPIRKGLGTATACSKLQGFLTFRHPSVIPILRLGTDDHHYYLVWPYMEEGATLSSLVQRQGRLPAKDVVPLALCLAEALAHCHEKGLFHGLLEPNDVRITEEGEVRILDFGLGLLMATEREESLVGTVMVADEQSNSLTCASPESLLDPTCRSAEGDQYSLGCILYYCLAGRFPFDGGTEMEQMMAHQLQEPAPLRTIVPGTPAWLEAVVARLLCKQPHERFPNPQNLVEALQERKFPGPAGGASKETCPIPSLLVPAPPQAPGKQVLSVNDSSAVFPRFPTSTRIAAAVLLLLGASWFVWRWLP